MYEDRKPLAKWSGNMMGSSRNKLTKVTVFIFKPTKTNYYVSVKFKGPRSVPVYGPLKGVTVLKPLEERKGETHRLVINYSKTGSHQGGPRYSFTQRVVLFFKDKRVMESLLKFLKKYTSKIVDKRVRKTKKRKHSKKRTKRR